jgi:hypothetical protein
VEGVLEQAQEDADSLSGVIPAGIPAIQSNNAEKPHPPQAGAGDASAARLQAMTRRTARARNALGLWMGPAPTPATTPPATTPLLDLTPRVEAAEASEVYRRG